VTTQLPDAPSVPRGLLAKLGLGRPDLYALLALTLVAFILRFFSPLFPDLYAHPQGHFDLSNCVVNTPVNAEGTPGTLCGLAYPFQRGYRSTPSAELSPPNGQIFDEIYFAVFAHDDLKGISYFDPEPPLAKLMIASGEWLYGEWRVVFEGAQGNPADLGFTPFGWRWMGSIFGTLVIPLMYLLALRLWANRLFAIAAATLTCFDGMFFIQSRIGMIDIFPIFFIILAYYLFHVHLQSKTPRSSAVTLLLTGVVIGLAIASKWIALAALASMLFILLVRLVRRYADVVVNTAGGAWRWGRSEELGPAAPGGMEIPAYVGLALVAFIAFPLVIYFASWIPFYERGQFHWANGLGDLIAYQKAAYDYHAHLTATHPYGSPWFSWPFLYRPVAYYFENTGLGIDANSGRPLVAGMVNLGNPWIWWSSIPCVLLLPYFAIRDKSYPAAFIALGFITQYLPWAPITRVLFLYHMFGGLIFMILGLAYVLARIASGSLWLGFGGGLQRLTGKPVLYVWLAVAILFFIYFYPVWTGIPIGDTQYLGGFGTGRMWFLKWI
jgi:dolichyl-phosphate-mannose-protein mannosyltransferase